MILSLDPGGTTGWAIYLADVLHRPDGGIEFYNERWNTGELGPEPHHLTLWDFLCQWQAQNYVVVCESFDFRKDKERDQIQYISKEYIGVVELFEQTRMCHFPGNLLVRQSAGEGKGFWYPRKGGRRDATKLKAIGHYTPGSIHINDAMSHLLHYMSFKLNRQDLFEGLK